MERRTLVAVALSFLVLYAYQAYFAPQPPPAGSSATQQRTAQQGTSSAASAPASTAAPQAAQPAPPAGAATVVGGTTKGDADAAIETEQVQATFSARGARLTHWRLKHFRDGRGEPVDLIPTNLPADAPAPFTLRVD